MADEIIDELNLKAFEASRARSAIESKVFKYKQTETQKLDDAMTIYVEATWGDAKRAALQTERDAKEAVEVYLELKAKTKTDYLYPIGTRLFEWKITGRGWDRNRAFVKTGKHGVTEIITSESIHAQTLQYSKAKRGDYVIRVIKKDGLPSANYVSSNYELTNHWFPEAVNPNTKDKP